jgi:hypothetical protein
MTQNDKITPLKIMSPHDDSVLRIEENSNVRWLYESKDIIRYLNALIG